MPLNIEVTQFPNGIGTVKDNDVLNAVPLPTPGVGALSVEDFGSDSNFAALWATTVIGAGAVETYPISASGVLTSTSAGAATDGLKQAANGAGAIVDAFNFVVGVAAWFGIRFRIDDPTNTILLFGLIPAAATVAPADGVYFRSADVTADLELVAENTSVEVATNLGTLAADTWYEAGFHWDGIDKISGQFTGPDGVVGGGGTVIPGASLPAVGLQPTFLFSAGAGAGAKVLDVDYVLFGGSR